MKLPFEPMIPIRTEHIPVGEQWGFQLKWDGVRIIAAVTDGQVQLYSRNGRLKNDIYPEIVSHLSRLAGSYVLDGEVVVFDPNLKRPVFHKVLQREKTKGALQVRQASPVSYVLFDILQWADQDLREMPYVERFEKLKKVLPQPSSQLFISDMYADGEALWKWVCEREWEGIVSKKLSSPYRSGKKHQDWLKMKTTVQFNVDIVGITLNEGRLASLIMVWEGHYMGRVSSGLDEQLKSIILHHANQNPVYTSPIQPLPAELKGLHMIWLAHPFRCLVKGQEITPAGLLRHPQILQFKEKL